MKQTALPDEPVTTGVYVPYDTTGTNVSFYCLELLRCFEDNVVSLALPRFTPVNCRGSLPVPKP